MFKRWFIKFLNLFGLTLQQKSNIIDSKTLHFKMAYPSFRPMCQTNEIFIRPIATIDMIFDGYIYTFEINVWYHDEHVIGKTITIGHCKEIALRYFNDFKSIDLFEKFLITYDAEKVATNIKIVVDKYTIDTYAEHYSKLHKVNSKNGKTLNNLGVTLVGTLDLSSDIAHANVVDRMGKNNGEVKTDNISDINKDLMDKFGFKQEFFEEFPVVHRIDLNKIKEIEEMLDMRPKRD